MALRKMAWAERVPSQPQGRDSGRPTYFYDLHRQAPTTLVGGDAAGLYVCAADRAGDGPSSSWIIVMIVTPFLGWGLRSGPGRRVPVDRGCLVVGFDPPGLLNVARPAGSRAKGRSAAASGPLQMPVPSSR